jgi:hypothetical protein
VGTLDPSEHFGKQIASFAHGKVLLLGVFICGKVLALQLHHDKIRLTEMLLRNKLVNWHYPLSALKST